MPSMTEIKKFEATFRARYQSKEVRIYPSKKVLGVTCFYDAEASYDTVVVYESKDGWVRLHEADTGVEISVVVDTAEAAFKDVAPDSTHVSGHINTRCDTELKLAEKDLLRNLRATIKSANKVIARATRKPKARVKKVKPASSSLWAKALLASRSPNIHFHVLKHEVASVKVPDAGGSKYHFVASLGPNGVRSGHKSNDTVYPVEFEVKLSRDHRTALDEILAWEQKLYDKYKGRGTHIFWRPLTATRCLLSYVIL